MDPLIKTIINLDDIRCSLFVAVQWKQGISPLPLLIFENPLKFPRDVTYLASRCLEYTELLITRNSQPNLSLKGRSGAHYTSWHPPPEIPVQTNVVENLCTILLHLLHHLKSQEALHLTETVFVVGIGPTPGDELVLQRLQFGPSPIGNMWPAKLIQPLVNENGRAKWTGAT